MSNIACNSCHVSVALFTRAWIEINSFGDIQKGINVALFTRAWIEIAMEIAERFSSGVALFTRAWIEIRLNLEEITFKKGRPLYEGVD